jgi:predicted kinase
VERVHGFQLQLLTLAPELFEQRVVEGRIVEGHGDLRPEHICFAERPVVFYFKEFSREFSELDVGDELAFLAAECDFLGAGWAGARLLEFYRGATGDRPPPVLVDFYKAYRACVRAKVAALRAVQLESAECVAEEERTAAADAAARHLEWADKYSQPWARPLVVAVGGLPGTGKSTLAKAVADALGAELLRTDEIRQELLGSGERAAVDGGIYRPEARQRVYRELFRRAAELAREQIPVVLDGTFARASLIEEARRLATDARTIWLAVECHCPAEVAHQRIRNRLEAGGDPSEARPEIHDRERQRWEAWPADLPQVRIETTSPLGDQAALVTTQLQPQYVQPHHGISGSAR